MKNESKSEFRNTFVQHDKIKDVCHFHTKIFPIRIPEKSIKLANKTVGDYVITNYIS